MPIYEYRCNRCGHEMEAIQKLRDSPLTFCPACETDGLKKKISAAVFRLKGKGWYETDFKSDDRKKNVAVDDGEASKDKENGKAKDKTEQQTGSDNRAGKCGKDGRSEKKAGDRTNGDSKPSPSKAASPE